MTSVTYSSPVQLSMHSATSFLTIKLLFIADFSDGYDLGGVQTSCKKEDIIHSKKSLQLKEMHWYILSIHVHCLVLSVCPYALSYYYPSFAACILVIFIHSLGSLSLS